jgi:hypothetical protein
VAYHIAIGEIGNEKICIGFGYSVHQLVSQGWSGHFRLVGIIAGVIGRAFNY